MDERVRACWRVHACGAGLCVGVQVFLSGAGAALPLCMNAAWIAAIGSVPAGCLAAFFCRRMLSEKSTGSRLLHAALFPAFLLNAAFAIVSLISLAEHSLLPQAQAGYSAAAALAAALLCALSGCGLARLSFALRFALPVLFSALLAAALPAGRISGLFPLLGTGLHGLVPVGVLMSGAAFPALLLLYVPAELARHCVHASLPDAGFFVRRMAAGAVCGVLLLFVLTVTRTYSACASEILGERLLITGAGPGEGLAQTGIAVLETLCMLLLAGHMLGGAARALLAAAPCVRSEGIALALCALLLAVLLYALIVTGLHAALYALPCLLVPLLLVPVQLLMRRKCHGT